MSNPAREDYLASIWRLTRCGRVASTTEVARSLGVSLSSASYMFKSMAAAGLADYREYSGVSLTPTGEAAALYQIRRHRLIERFLVDVLGIPWDTVHEMADEMEHSVPDPVLERMEAVMGYPNACPHGHPIPQKDGTFRSTLIRLLSDLAAGEGGTIGAVSEADPALLRYLASHGLRPGTRIDVLIKDAIGGTVTLGVAEGSIVIASSVAQAVSLLA